MPLPEFKTYLEVIDFDDFESLTDEEMLDLCDLLLEALEKIQTINPEITDEMIQTFKKGINNFAMACHKEREAHKAAEIAQKNVERSADALLMHPDLRDGKPLPIIPKRRGN